MSFRLFQSKVETRFSEEKYLGQNVDFRDRNFPEISMDTYINSKRVYKYGLFLL